MTHDDYIGRSNHLANELRRIADLMEEHARSKAKGLPRNRHLEGKLEDQLDDVIERVKQLEKDYAGL